MIVALTCGAFAVAGVGEAAGGAAKASRFKAGEKTVPQASSLNSDTADYGADGVSASDEEGRPQDDASSVSSTGSDAEGESLRSGGEYTNEQIAGFWKFINEHFSIYSRMHQLASASKYDLIDIGLPGSVPPKASFSQTLHTLISEYTNLAHDWIYQCEQDGLLTPDRSYLATYTPELAQGAFDAFLQLKDPLLRPSLVHLLYLCLQNKEECGYAEREYVALRMQWVEETLLPPGVIGLRWRVEYQRLYQELVSAPDQIQIIDVPSMTKARLKQKLRLPPFSENNGLAMKYMDVKSNPLEQLMTTAWEAGFALFQSGMQASESDALMYKHAQFVARLIQKERALSQDKRILAMSWLETAAIKSQKQKHLNWRDNLYSYKLPEPDIANKKAMGRGEIKQTEQTVYATPSLETGSYTDTRIAMARDILRVLTDRETSSRIITNVTDAQSLKSPGHFSLQLGAPVGLSSKIRTKPVAEGVQNYYEGYSYSGVQTPLSPNTRLPLMPAGSGKFM
ncbi:hypothetical protein [Parendozoicomonas haliclonae]|uniref:hypothetical protein n=1 Tax=Parendozoicomonas haliclonae TaxID=1960125 RepID=UPI000B34F29D|nr:hypothetical protein [Parendozoicomonas haliclonae]